MSVSDASQLCAAKRTDCVLVVDEDEHLCGIFTAKDLAFRVRPRSLPLFSCPTSSLTLLSPPCRWSATVSTLALPRSAPS